ncbi:hypothetical protein PP180_00275 [Muricauda sp. SK9]|nr:hypothetical protein [Muricauda sp. SK9]MDC6383784.1 hypothetical protein [Muricauda sp. SK9]
MIPSKKNNLKERYLHRYIPFFWNLGSKSTNHTDTDRLIEQSGLKGSH